MDSIWQYGGFMMSFIKRMNWVWIVMILGTIGVWYSVFINGLFITVMGLIIGSSIAGIIIKLREDTRV